MDAFGVAPASIAELERCFGPAAREYAAASAAGDPRHARELQQALQRRIQEAGGFAAVDISVVHSFQADVPAHLTFNITLAAKKPSVEYLPQPNEDVPDPEGLLASWREYEMVGSALDFDGQLPASPPCPAHHCLYGFDHPKLRAFRESFLRKVPVQRAALVKVLRTDKNDKDRASAAYLLAHLHDAKDVLDALLPRLRDPAPNVRNSILRVLGFMAEHEEARSIPLEPILPFLASPVLTDRNKAVAIVAAMASDKSDRRLLIDRSGCDLVRLLETMQPNQSDFAHQALVKLHGADLGAADSAAWRKWLKTRGVVCAAEPKIGPGRLCPLSAANFPAGLVTPPAFPPDASRSSVRGPLSSR